MAMATTALCPNCDKQEGIVPCLGCQKIFCVKHFQIHRQNLSVELEDVVTRRNTLQDYYYNTIAPTFDPTTFDSWKTIDEWEQEMKNQIGKTADQARKQLDIYSQQSRTQIEQQLNQMTGNIQQKMERENFIEEDIEKLTQQIDEMEDGIRNNHYHPRIEIISQPIDWNAAMQVKLLVENEPTIEQPPIPLLVAPLVTSKPKYPPSVQRKCYTCGADTWQKECKCCAHIYCGWHLKRHVIETKKH
jgi:excinuclease UvrABC ATPase subunit